MISRKASYKAFTNIPARRRITPVKAEEPVKEVEPVPPLHVEPESIVINEPPLINHVEDNFVKPCEKDIPRRPINFRRQAEVVLPVKSDFKIAHPLPKIEAQSLISKTTEIIRPVKTDVKEDVKQQQFDRQSVLLKPIQLVGGKRERKISECLTNVQGDQFKELFLKRKKPRISPYAQKVSDAKKSLDKKIVDGVPDRGTMTMFDFIYYNPPSNPMKEEDTEGLAKVVKLLKEPIDSIKENDNDEKLSDDEEEKLRNGHDEDYEMEKGGLPAPRVKIGANGEIILDEKSLLLETNDAKRGRENMKKQILIESGRDQKKSHYSKRMQRGKDWPPSETKLFYKVLNTIGTDFSLMLQVFPDRSRKDLKNKFKFEEKENPILIQSALSRPAHFNMSKLLQDIEKERTILKEEAEKQKDIKRHTVGNTKRGKYRKRTLDDEVSDVDDVKIENEINPRKSKRKIKKLDYKLLMGEEDEPEEFLNETSSCGALDYSKKTGEENVDGYIDRLENAKEEEAIKKSAVSGSEFIQLLDNRLKSLDPTTIRLQFDSANQVQVILDDIARDILDEIETSEEHQFSNEDEPEVEQEIQTSPNDVPENRTFLTGLTAGSYVYLTSKKQEENKEHCSVYKIEEFVQSDGSIGLRPIPVDLPDQPKL